ncbi:methyltransferase [Lithospermum erythrorhizon]|uniref:Methyltransferase n=1 Tax=Lithospermum erythrorhizon TaxID=34254 RepID=A0AAV3Q7A4_LITER
MESGEGASSVPNSYHVLGGNGTYSYSRNSEYQMLLLELAKEKINELIGKHLDIEKPSFDYQESFRIADFGCSTGPNTFFSMQNIVEAIRSNLRDHAPDFFIFFNDLVGNDFNTLFRNLPPKRTYYVASLPGSFYSRLLPEASLHIANCSTSLHWLSKIPHEVTNKNSLAWNEGKVHYLRAPKAVKDAYSTQFKQDIEAFLSARAQELVAGGLMVLIVNGFPDGSFPSNSITSGNFKILESCSEDMVKMGMITKEMADMFNLPFYYPSPAELKASIEANGHFTIERLEKLDYQINQTNVEVNIQSSISLLRAIIGGLIVEHFGNDTVDYLFELYTEKYSANPVILDDEYKGPKVENYFVFLKRKGMN